jgi:ABC-type sugar transport system ATPase subunit
VKAFKIWDFHISVLKGQSQALLMNKQAFLNTGEIIIGDERGSGLETAECQHLFGIIEEYISAKIRPELTIRQ